MPKDFIWRHRLALSTTVAFLIVVTIVGLSYWNTSASMEASRWVEHTDQVISTLTQTLAHVSASESAQRAYVITGNELYADEARAMQPAIRSDLTLLRELVADNPAQLKNAQDLESAINRKLRYVEAVMQVRHDKGFDAAKTLAAAGQGHASMQAVTQRIDAMRNIETRLLNGRSERSRRQSRRALTVLWVASAIDLFFVVAIVILVMRDFGRRSELSRALAVARDSALQAAEMRSQFLANMSHEIRTPLNAIIGMTGLLVTTELDDDQRELANTVRGSADALLTIVNDILDFSKIEAGKLLIEDVDFDIRNTIDSVIDLLSENARARKVEMGALFDHDIPAILRGDAGRIRQVLTNLVGNAIKFTGSGGEVIVQTNLIRSDDAAVHVRFSVTDTGIGMSEEVARRLFQPFSQADASTTRQYGGTGLGLAICRQLVELMGGTIALDSAPGKGSTFWFTLPLRRADVTAAADERVDLEGLRVLVVDDNPTQRRVLHHNLDAWKMEGDGVSSGVQALARLRDAAGAGEPYSVAIVDMFMPGMDGLELARTIKRDPEIAGTHLIMVTSIAERLDPAQVAEAGFESSLVKPVKQSALFDAIVNAIAGRRRVRRFEHPEPREPLIVRHGTRILIAEDNPVNQKLAVRQLKRLGIDADPVGNGAEAIEALSRIPYDLVLMDCQMPEMDGFEATRRIRSREGHAKHTPVIALTANALEGDRERCLDAGMDDYLAKPVSESDLERVLERWLGTAPPTEELPVPVKAETIAYLREVGGSDENFLHDLIDMYEEDAAGRIGGIRAAIAGADPTELASCAHALKSSAGNVGAMSVRAIAETIEEIGRNGSIEGAAAEADKLEAEHARAVECLRGYEN
jgi:two-component system, sensor histidine kinase and response regulator